jgi:hypothetical protein
MGIALLASCRENKIRQQFHPSHLIQFLENNNVSDNDNEKLDIFWN